jgi:hypothetical protein
MLSTPTTTAYAPQPPPGPMATAAPTTQATPLASATAGRPPKPTGPPVGQNATSGSWMWDEVDGKWYWESKDPGWGSGGQDRGNPTGTAGAGGAGGTTTAGGTPIDSGTPISPDGKLNPSPVPTIGPWQDPSGGFSLGGVVGGYTPPNTDWGAGMQGIDMRTPGAAEQYYAQNQAGYGAVGANLSQLYQQMNRAYGQGVATPQAGNAPASSFGALPNLNPNFGPLPTMGSGPGAFGAPPKVGGAPAPGFGALPEAQYGKLANRFGDSQLPGAFTGSYGGYQGPTGAPTGQFDTKGGIAGNAPPGSHFQNAPNVGAMPGDFFDKDIAPADMGAYYDNAARKANEQITKQMSAQGQYGSSASGDMISEAMTNLAAERAKAEAQYGLDRSAESRAWETARTGYGLERSQDQLARSKNALDWEQAGAGYGLDVSQDAQARSNLALNWQQASKDYEMDVANYGVDVANQRLQYQQQSAEYGLDAYGQNLARNQQQLAWEQAGGQYDISRAGYGIDLMSQQLAGQQAAANYGLNVSEDAIARGNLDLGYTQAKGQYDIGLGAQNIDRYNSQLAGQQAQANYGLNAYNAQLAGKQAQMGYGLSASQDALARAQFQQSGQAMNLQYANMLGQLAGASAGQNLNALNSGMNAATAAQQAQTQRAQNAYNNSMSYGSAISNTMGVNYENMFKMDAGLYSQMQQLGLGQGAEGLSQALMQYGLDQTQINNLMEMAKSNGQLTTGMIDWVKKGGGGAPPPGIVPTSQGGSAPPPTGGTAGAGPGTYGSGTNTPIYQVPGQYNY